MSRQERAYPLTRQHQSVYCAHACVVYIRREVRVSTEASTIRNQPTERGYPSLCFAA